MGTKKKPKYKTYQEIDKLVAKYKDPKTTPEDKAKVLEVLLASFNRYLMKYARLFKNSLDPKEYLANKDTLEFLSLFSGIQTPAVSKPKKKETNWFRQIYQLLGKVCWSLEETEIYDELCAQFIELLNKYKVYPGTSFARYLTKYMRWGMKAWIVRVAKENRTYFPLPDESIDSLVRADKYQADNNSIDLPEMNLQWIANPKGSKIFQVLTPYERLLIYMSFKQGLGVRGICKKLTKGKNTINKHLRQAVQKLREQYRKEYNYAESYESSSQDSE